MSPTARHFRSSRGPVTCIRCARCSLLLVVFVGFVTTLSPAANPAQPPAVPFKGAAEEQAISAVPVDPDHLLVTTVGGGNATHLGQFTFISPHLSGLSDFSIDGTQTFTAANGDQLQANIVGNLQPQPDSTGHVFLVGDVQGTITGGTGRFANASGSFTFSIVFDTQTLHSTASIDGTIRFAGK
jgi:hypothetical protein